MISEEIQKKIELLPQRIVAMVYSIELTDLVIRIRKQFDLTQDQVIELNETILDIFIRNIRIEEFNKEIKTRLGLEDGVARQISFMMLSGFFYGAKDFFPGIEDEIIKLGGEIPRDSVFSLGEQFARREREMEEMTRREEEEREKAMADSIIYDKISSLMVQFPEVEGQIIGLQPSIEVYGATVPMKPMIKYWIEDYIAKNGHEARSNLNRVQYVCHDKNTRSMNNEERRQLMLILKSVDEGLSLPYSSRIKKIDFALTEEE